MNIFGKSEYLQLQQTQSTFTILKVLNKRPSGNSRREQNHSSNHARGDVSTFRRVLPQVIASSINNLQILDFGLTMAFPAVVIGALTGMNDDMNSTEFLHASPMQASWLGSIMFIAQPLGNLLSGLLSEPFGRKLCMYLGSIAHMIAYALFYTGSTLNMIFIALILLGIGVGITEAPNNNYLGEINEPSVRGSMMSCAGLCVSVGVFIVFLTNLMMSWRMVALVCAIIPCVTFFALFFVPETPIWLLSKSRKDDAKKSLQWLRGWVPAKAVQKEFDDLQSYEEASNACLECQKKNMKCIHPPPTITDKLHDLVRKRTMKPFAIITFMFFILQFSGMFAMRPYILQILSLYGVPFNANQSTAIMGLIGIVSCVILLCCLRIVGKRYVYLCSIVATFFCCFGLGAYGYRYLPNGAVSFNLNEEKENNGTENISVFPIASFLALQFFSSLGVSTVPNMLVSEMFPFKSRVFACGIIAAVNNVFAFVASKIHYELELLLSLPGVMLFYGVFGFVGFIVAYYCLPETENRSLEDIERHFSDNNKKFTDIYIHRSDIETLRSREP